MTVPGERLMLALGGEVSHKNCRVGEPHERKRSNAKKGQLENKGKDEELKVIPKNTCDIQISLLSGHSPNCLAFFSSLSPFPLSSVAYNFYQFLTIANNFSQLLATFNSY